ncbi:MAG: DNA polymerase I [Lachnospiraceae bacterium]|nr:DNA polymerase I [Lachnospiraceae bacterium]
MSEKLVLIDGNSIINRAFFGIPTLTNADGFHTNAIYGFLNIMFKILDEENPDYLAIAFDLKAPTFRHKLYPEYKGTRKGMPDELREQVPVLKELLRAMQITTVESEGYEADDILGTLAKKAEASGIEVSLVSGDRDLLQIATDKIKIRIPKTKGGKTEVEDYYTADVIEKYGLEPYQIIELKALMGDSSDNIPGVPKIGEKTATALIQEYGNIETLKEHIGDITKKSIKETLSEHFDMAELSKTLATINIDAPVDTSFEDKRIRDMYTSEAYDIVKRLGFKNMIQRFENTGVKKENIEIKTVEIKDESEAYKLLNDCLKDKKTAIQCFVEDGLFGASVCREEGLAYFLPVMSMYSEGISEDKLKEIITGIVKSAGEDHKIITFGAKELYHICPEIVEDWAESGAEKRAEDWAEKGTERRAGDGSEKAGLNAGTQAASYIFDTKLASYLLNPLKSDYYIDDVAIENDISMQSYKELFDKLKIKDAWLKDKEAFRAYAAKCAYVSFASYERLKERLEKNNEYELFENIEMPLTVCLFDMEKEGIKVKPNVLREYGIQLTEQINELERDIIEEAGEEFNINSPKQLGEILFGKMKLPGGKKTKTGYSTAADVLEKLSVDHPFVKKILDYRGLSKLKSTYADGLLPYISEDERIHSTFHQTITATGRISSADPNLQNIPIRMEQGRLIRKAFVPREGCIFLDADYSQIELRILAHMSQDETLIEAFREGQDIHRITASKVFNVPFEEVTSLQRRNAKAVNFGIIYGISAFGLSQDIGISAKEAREFIDNYFVTFPKVKQFLDRLVSDAREKGYAETLYNRKRPVPELKESNFMRRQFGERVAMNAPIQGTAADIMKIAMIRVMNRLRAEGLKTKVILQVHDELLLETEISEKEKVSAILKEEMENAAELSVNLTAEMSEGTDWYEAK